MYEDAFPSSLRHSRLDASFQPRTMHRRISTRSYSISLLAVNDGKMSRKERWIPPRSGVEPMVRQRGRGSRWAMEGTTLMLFLFCSRPVLSSQIEFDPKGSQAASFALNPPHAAVGGILIAKMRGGQVS
jgi:hypothetical protein